MPAESMPPLLSLEVILEKISEIALQIQQDRELEDILQGAIADARELLQADRVLIYRLLAHQDAVVAFESVGREWTPLLGQTIPTPSLNPTWIDQYRQKPITAASDIHGEDLSPWDIEWLAGLEVKAHLVVPLLSQGVLWGLLLVHDCRRPRVWQPLEGQYVQQLAVHLGIAIQQTALRQSRQHLADHLEQLQIAGDESSARGTATPKTSAIQLTSGETLSQVSEQEEVRKLREELIQNIALGVSAQIGEAFFHSLVQYLSRLLGMDLISVGELIAPERNCVKIIAGLSHDHLLDGVEYPLADTPCEQVIQKGFCIYPQNLQHCFPENRALQDLEAEAYIGVPLVSSSGEVIGLISVISQQAIANAQLIQEVLTIFAVRATSELERQQSEAMLRRYERIVSATPDCVSLLDRNYIYQVINQTYLTWSQKSYDQIVGHSVSDLLGQEFFETVSKPFLDRCLAGEPRQIVEAWLDYADGQRRFVRATYTPYLEADGTISGVVVNVHELTDLKLAEAALRESEERFRQMATSIREVFWLADINFTEIFYISPMYEEVWGRSCASLYKQPRSFLESIHPEDLPQVLAVIQQQRLTGFSHEYRLLSPDGSVRWIGEQAFPVVDATGHPYRLVGVSQDISDRKAASAALEASKQQYQNLVENSPDIIERFDTQLRHLYVSPALTKITGIPTETFLGKTCRDLGLNTAMVNTWETAVAALLATRQRQIIEFELPTLEGMRSFEMVIAPELSDQQTIESILCMSRDITDRKTTEIALKEQQQFTEQIASSTLAILYVYDLIEHRNIYSNQQIEMVLGYSPEEIQTMGEALFPLLIHPEDLPQVMVNQQHLLTVPDNEFVETEYRMRHKNGNYRWLLSRDRIFSRTAEGLPQRSLGVATDITLLKEAQATLHQQAEYQRLLMVIAQHIRQTLDLENILQTTVTEVRQFLDTDRVIIYKFEPDWSGIIIAESVAEGLPSIMGIQITDTCLVENQGLPIERSGIIAIEDILNANLDPCRETLFKQMQVRAKLMVPILQDDHLWGLLIAHHCRSPRHWETLELDLQQQLALSIQIAIQQASLYRQSQLELAERQRAEMALQQLNQELEQRVQERTQILQQQTEQERLLRLIIQNIHRSLDLEEVLTAVLTETRQTFQADRVAIYQFHPDWSGTFVAESVGEGWVPLVSPDIPKVWEDTYLQETQGGRYQNNETFQVNDIYTIGHTQCHIDLLEQFQARAYAIAPIFLDEKLWGLLATFQNSGPRNWQDWEINLLQQISLQTAIALRQSHLYQASQAQVRELERLSQLKDDFLSTVSHELRSPMSSIKMATQMLELTLNPLGILADESAPISRYFRILREEGKREIDLINDLLDLARLDAGTEPLNLSMITLQLYIPHLAKTFLERTRNQQQQLVIQIPEDLPDVTTDLPYLERILTELLHNACKYTPAGETITVAVAPRPDTLEIRVSNSGVEIPAVECDRIFDKFYRVPNNDPWKHGGTGLGLALVKKLVERLGGTIQVESCFKRTTFILVFGLFPESHRQV
ncbi:hypothetical protein DO97_15120 [Neosynechococcus sphagnicola sy1]|uniref:histidine kinase n=1 Tax=Neosynechococcus sphagnicola sy1 TaxID=1497020 RepID=A0A098TSB5_9CYAN|nr:GAF domain-containing protein [Neosynechococcus sphagnicola]KGF73643.1 hypothetical protein DO97_15120 [Neosynechococcus sphagnicola sy1]